MNQGKPQYVVNRFQARLLPTVLEHYRAPVRVRMNDAVVLRKMDTRLRVGQNPRSKYQHLDGKHTKLKQIK